MGVQDALILRRTRASQVPTPDGCVKGSRVSPRRARGFGLKGWALNPKPYPVLNTVSQSVPVHVCVYLCAYIYICIHVCDGIRTQKHTEDVFLLLNSILLVQFSMDPLGLCSDTYSSKKSGCF